MTLEIPYDRHLLGFFLIKKPIFASLSTPTRVMPIITDYLPYYTLGLLSLVIVIATSLLVLSKPRNTAYLYYILHTLMMATLIVRNLLVKADILTNKFQILWLNIATDVFSAVFYTLFVYYFSKDVMARKQQLYLPFIRIYLGAVLLYLLIFATLYFIGSPIGTLALFHQYYLLSVTLIGTMGVIFFVIRLPRVLMAYILLGSMSLVLGAGLSIYLSGGHIPFIVNSPTEVITNVESYDTTFLQLAMVIDAACFGMAIIKKNQYQKGLLEQFIAKARQQATTTTQLSAAPKHESCIPIQNGVADIRLPIHEVLLVESTKFGKLKVSYRTANELLEQGLTNQRFQDMIKQLPSEIFFVARRRNPQMIVHRDFIQSINQVMTQADKVKYQSTAMLKNGQMVVIAKNKKAAFESWYYQV